MEPTGNVSSEDEKEDAVRKQMEGDNRERRKRAGKARDEGKQPSEDHGTLGSSKQWDHARRAEEHHEKIDRLRGGKQGGAVQKNLPDKRPRKKF